MGSGTRLVDKSKIVVALHSTVPSTTSPKWVSLKGYNHVSVIVSYKNSTTVTGSAITLQQATAVAGTSAKALAFTEVFATVGDSASSALTDTVVTGNTFTADATNNGTGIYVIEVAADSLDLANQFDCFQLACGNATAQALEVTYVLGNVPRYSGGYNSFMEPLNN